MDFFPWTDEYSVGIRQIDEEHKALVTILNSFYNEMQENNVIEMIQDVFLKLIGYTSYHFKSEEDLFDKYNYPRAIEHKEQHAELIKQIMKYKSDFKEDRLMIITVASFLKNWLETHILREDMGYRNYLNSKGVY